jgi:hypothetical protein
MNLHKISQQMATTFTTAVGDHDGGFGESAGSFDVNDNRSKGDEMKDN